MPPLLRTELHLELAVLKGKHLHGVVGTLVSHQEAAGHGLRAQGSSAGAHLIRMQGQDVAQSFDLCGQMGQLGYTCPK
jgi:hypothetical protein